MLADHHVRICMSQVKGRGIGRVIFFVDRCREQNKKKFFSVRMRYPQQQGEAYQLGVGRLLKANARGGHAIVQGVDAREWHLVQIYVSSMFCQRVTAQRQLAALQLGKHLKSKNGTSPLLYIDHFEVSLPQGVRVTRQYDSKYTDKPKLPFDNASKTVHLASMNGLPTVLVTNAPDCDGDIKTAMSQNSNLTMQTISFDAAAATESSDGSAATTGPTFVARDYQIEPFRQLRQLVTQIDQTRQNTILARLEAAFGKTHVPFVLMDLLLWHCDVCFITVTQINLANNFVTTMKKFHAHLDITLEVWTSASEAGLMKKLGDPDVLEDFRASRKVPILYHRTFEKVYDKLDLKHACIIADEVHNYAHLAKEMSVRLFIGLSARNDNQLKKCFEHVVELDEVDEERMRRTGWVDRIVVRIDALRDTGESSYEDMAAAIASNFAADIEEMAAKTINAYNFSPFRQAVVVCPDKDCQLKDFDAFREKLHDKMLETNGDVYICEFKRLWGAKRDVHHVFFCDALKRRLEKAGREGKERVALLASELERFKMHGATKDSIISVNGDYWVACGFQIVRQDSESDEAGFKRLQDMLEYDWSGIMQTKKQFFEGQNFPLLRHIILTGRVLDYHRLYQLIMRVARGTAYAMVTSTGGTTLDTFLRMLEVYDPKARLVQLECFQNLSLSQLVAFGPEDWKATCDRREVGNQALQTRRMIAKESTGDDTVAYLLRYHASARPTVKMLQIPYPVDWEKVLTVVVEACRANSNIALLRKLVQLQWLEFNAKGGILDTSWMSSGGQHFLTYDRVDAKFPPGATPLEPYVRRVAEHFLSRNEPLPRGMFSICTSNGACNHLVPVHIVCTLHDMLAKNVEYELPSIGVDIPKAALLTPPCAIHFEGKGSTTFPIQILLHQDAVYRMYTGCLTMFEPVLRDPRLLSSVYDLNCAFQSCIENVHTTLLPLHKWSMGYANDMPYSSTGRSETNEEPPYMLKIKPVDFGLHTNMVEVYRRFNVHHGLVQNHNSLNHKLSKIYYVQLILFSLLLRWSKLAREGERERYFTLVYIQLKQLRVHSAFAFDSMVGHNDKRVRLTE